MKTWLAIMTAGSLLVAYTMNNDNGIGSKLVELKSDIVAYNAERAYASTNDTVDSSSLIYVTVRDHISTLKAALPLTCTDGFIYLQRMDDINSSMPINPNETSSITQEINLICGTSITPDSIKG
jgi:hypothetical protein